MKTLSAKKKKKWPIEECTETAEEVKLAKITLSEDKNNHKCSPWSLYIVLFSIILTINVGINSYFVYSHWYLKEEDFPSVEFGTRTQKTIY